MKNIIDYKQCIILWHVNDLKTSNVDPAIISGLLFDIDASYGKIKKVITMLDKFHKYLGMAIE